MKLSDKTIREIVKLKDQGLSSRKVGKILSLGKTTVNENYLKYKYKPLTTKPKPRILFFDLETSPSIGAFFGRFNQNLGHNSIIREGGIIISAAWKFLGDEKVSSTILTPEEATKDSDLRICCELYDLFEKADIIVAHNAPFDLSVFRARLALNRLPMHKKVKVIDTYKISKSMRFNSRKLDSLADYFDLGRKLTHSGIDLWIRCMQGDKEALEEMQKYNAVDVELLEELWHCIRAYDSKPLNLGQYYNDNQNRCPACGSVNVVSTGNLVYTEVSAFDEVKCDDCGHRSRKRQQRNPKEKRDNLLM